MQFAEIAAEVAQLSVRAGRLAQQARTRMERSFKPDGSVVTNGDREVETFLRAELPRIVPDATIWGEEFGFDEEGPGGLWVVDPVDGTSNYAVGSPLWGVSIGLVRGEQIVAGVVALPDLNEVYVVSYGGGVTVNDRPLPPIPAGPVLKHELVGYCESVSRFGYSIPGRQRCSGAFVVEGAWVATQRFRGIVGVREKLYDVAPCILMGQELGGEVRYADGSDLDMIELKKGGKILKPWVIFPAETGFIAG